MNWMNKWEQERTEAEDRLAGRTLASDSTVAESEAFATVRAEKELAAELERAERIKTLIEDAERYIDTGLWKPGLEMLRDLLENPDVSNIERKEVDRLYRQGVLYMEEEQKRHPDDVEEFSHAVLTNHNTHI
jgi:hypothetical protein